MKQLKKAFLVLLPVLLLQLSAMAQGTITGRVVDQNNLGIPGATVRVKGKSLGTKTDFNGNFKLDNVAEGQILEISSIGMLKKEVAASNNMLVKLEVSSSKLNKVVITALGVAKERRSLGYSVGEVKGNTISSSGEANAIQGLAGKAAGVQVVGSGGTPGTSSKILLRGNSSFGRSNQPLIVIDGVPIDNSQGNFNTSGASDYPFNGGLNGVNSINRGADLNPDDIESVTILKGPAAASLYGARGGNGAIIITTKKGKKGSRVRVQVGSSVEFSKVNKLPELQDKFAGGGSPSSGPSSAPVGPNGTAYSWGARMDSLGLIPYDNVGNFFQTGVSFNNNISVAGGTEKTGMRLSVGRTDIEGMIPNSNWSRTSTRLTVNSDVTDRLKVGGTVNYINSGGTRVQNGSNLGGIMLTLMRAPRDFDLKGSGDEGYLNADGTPRNAFFPYDNPFYSAYKNPNRDKVDRMIGNVNTSYKISDWMNVSWRLGTDIYSDRRTQQFGIHSYEPNPGPVGELVEYSTNYNQYYSDLLLNMTHDFNKDLKGKLTLGNNLWHTDTKDLFLRGRNMNVPGFYNLNNFTDLYAGNYATTQRTAALFFDGGLSYKDYLFLNVSGRNEWSSTFGANKNNFFYPAISGSFVFSDVTKIPKMSFGKIRLGYAESGISPRLYSSRTYYSRKTAFTDGFTAGLGYPYLGSNGFGLSSIIGNPDVRPERQKGIEIGADLRFFKDRLTLDVTYYNQKSVDILLDRPIASASGYEYLYSNAGEMVNKGIELGINATPVFKKNWRWDIGMNFTKNVNEVLALADGVEEFSIESAFTSIGSFAIVGDPYGALYGTKWQRTTDGQLVIDPNTGLPLIDAERGNVGNPFPDWLMNITTGIRYKRWKISGLLDIRKGGDIWAGTYARLTRHGVTKITEDRNETTVIPGVLADANGEATTTPNNISIPKWQYYTNYLGDFGATEQAVYDGSWVRLRELTLSHNFNIKSNKVFKRIKVYATGRNLWLSTDYPGVDPETSLTGSGSNVNGFDYFNNPGSKSYIFGVKFGL